MKAYRQALHILLITTAYAAMARAKPVAVQASAPVDASACQIEAATYNITTMQRMAYVQGMYDYATALAKMTAVLADDPCIAAQAGFASVTKNIAVEGLTASQTAPMDLLIYAGLGLHPYSAQAREQQGLPARPSLVRCRPDDHAVIQPLESWRAASRAGRVDEGFASQRAMTILWKDECSRTHIIPLDIMMASQSLMGRQLVATSAWEVIQPYFH